MYETVIAVTQVLLTLDLHYQYLNLKSSTSLPYQARFRVVLVPSPPILRIVCSQINLTITTMDALVGPCPEAR